MQYELLSSTISAVNRSWHHKMSTGLYVNGPGRKPKPYYLLPGASPASDTSTTAVRTTKHACSWNSLAIAVASFVLKGWTNNQTYARGGCHDGYLVCGHFRRNSLDIVLLLHRSESCLQNSKQTSMTKLGKRLSKKAASDT